MSRCWAAANCCASTPTRATSRPREPPAALHATPRSCSVEMVRSDADRFRRGGVGDARRKADHRDLARGGEYRGRARELPADRREHHGERRQAIRAQQDRARKRLSASRRAGPARRHAARLQRRRARAWWDATFYDLHVDRHPADSTIRGWNAITYRVLKPAATEMQIDLQAPLEVDSIVQDGARSRCDATATRSSSRCGAQQPGAKKTVTVYYHGMPRAAKNPPWDGGLHLAARPPRQPLDRDRERGTRRERLVAEQGLSGGRAGQPAHRDHGARLDDRRVERPAAQARRTTRDGTTTYEWFVGEPINNYDVEINAGHVRALRRRVLG